MTDQDKRLRELAEAANHNYDGADDWSIDQERFHEYASNNPALPCTIHALYVKLEAAERRVVELQAEHAKELRRVKQEYYAQGRDSHGGTRHPLDMD